MDRDTIIRLARDAGLVYFCVDGWTSPTPENKHAEGVDQEALERFAALVIANNPPQSWMTYQLGLETGKQTGASEERKRIVDMLLNMHAKEERHNNYLFIANIIKESQ